MHGVFLDFVRRQLADGVMLITPMPQPLFLHVLQPVVKPVPQPKWRKNKPLARRAPPEEAQAPDQPTDLPVEGSAIDTESQAAHESPPEVAQLSETADASSADLPTALEQPVVSPDPPDAWPVDTRLSYSVKGYYRGDFDGWGQVQWQHRDGRYQVQVDMRVASLFTGTLISQGELTAEGLQPRVYEERGLGRVGHLAFDGAAVILNDGSILQKPPGVQDTASQFVELTHRFTSGREALEVGAEVPVWLARPREMHLWTYDVVALETLRLADLGEVPAYHLKPRPLANPRGVINAELWFAPSLQYLPVRIRVNLANDNYVELTVKRIEQGEFRVNAPH